LEKVYNRALSSESCLRCRSHPPRLNIRIGRPKWAAEMRGRPPQGTIMLLVPSRSQRVETQSPWIDAGANSASTRWSPAQAGWWTLERFKGGPLVPGRERLKNGAVSRPCGIETWGGRVRSTRKLGIRGAGPRTGPYSFHAL